MKKIFGIVFLLVVFVSATAFAVEPANQTAWRFYLKADDGLGGVFMAQGTLGIASTSKDGYGEDGTVSDTQDGIQNWSGQSPGARGVLTPFGGVAYLKSLQSLRSPLNSAYAAPNSGFAPFTKAWNLKVFNLPDPTVASNYIRLQFFTVAATVLPVTTVKNVANQDVACTYTLRMVDNKGVEGAPANNTVWNIPIPTVHSTTIPYFTLTLPLRTLTSGDQATAMAQGYDMQFVQSVVPEPSSLAALGFGLISLFGLARRRRGK